MQPIRFILNSLRERKIIEELHVQIRNSARLRDIEKEKSPSRTEIINYCISQRRKEHYLEIGVRNPAYNFDLIKIDNKISVDPGL